MQGDTNPFDSLDQEDALAQHQELSLDEMDVDEEPDDVAGWAADSTDI
jgi:hypothetical protein